jgi:hypothetical protein
MLRSVQRYKVSMVDGKVHLDGFPDAVWLASTSVLLPRLSGQLADMALHQSDLRFALDCLTQIQAPSASEVVREALWQCAIVNYFKCFDEHSNARSTALKSRKVLDPGLPRQIHRNLLNLRNKYLAHDDNAWLQAKPAAVIAPRGKSYSIEKVTVTTFRSGTLDTGNFGNILLLVRRLSSGLKSACKTCATR